MANASALQWAHGDQRVARRGDGHTANNELPRLPCLRLRCFDDGLGDLVATALGEVDVSPAEPLGELLGLAP
jgi:hypothetical protein